MQTTHQPTYMLILLQKTNKIVIKDEFCLAIQLQMYYNEINTKNREI